MQTDRLKGSAAVVVPDANRAIEAEHPIIPKRSDEVGRLAVRMGTFARMFDTSTSTIRRRMKDDPTFPKPFRLSPTGDLLWRVADIHAYAAAKATTARAA